MEQRDGTLGLAEQLSIGLRGFLLMARKTGDAFPVTRQQLDVLGSLADGPRRVSDLADELGVRMPTVTTQLTRLERDGLVTRDRGAADARVVMISLTGQGTQMLKQGLDRWYAALGSQIESLTEGERLALEAAAPVLRKVFPLPAAVRDAARTARVQRSAPEVPRSQVPAG